MFQNVFKVLVEQHGMSEKYPQPRILAVQANSSADEEESAIDLTSNRKETDALNHLDKNSISCSLCPAKFNRDSKALQYHVSLHGSSGPFRCRFCNYAVKAQDNLNKHEKLHLQNANNDDDDDQEVTEPIETAATDNGKPIKRFHCSKCPSSFEKKEQFKVHSNLHGSKQRYRCDRCDYAVKYYANYLQHVKNHEEQVNAHESMELDNGDSTVAAVDLPDQPPLSTADRQHIWLQDKLRSVQPQTVREPLHCQFCPFTSENQDELTGHIGHHAVNGATGSYRCNFCDFTVADRQEDLSEHIGLHFQLKGRSAAKLPESYWKCSNLEIWSEPVTPLAGATNQQPEVVYDEKAKPNDNTDVEEDDEDALYIDLSTGHPVRDELIESTMPTTSTTTAVDQESS